MPSPGEAYNLTAGQESNKHESLALEIHIKKLIRKPSIVGVACGSVYEDGQLACNTENLTIALVSLG